MPFRKGHKPWNTGKKRPPFSEETLRKMSERSKGKRNPMYGKSNPWAGWQKGHKDLVPVEARQRQSATMKKRGHKPPTMIGSEHPHWKGESAGYYTKHKWIYLHYGKASKCENRDCSYENPKRYDWANISHKYKRDISDYMQLCPSCHTRYDKGIIKIRK